MKDEYIRRDDAIDAATQDSTENRTHLFRAGQARSASRIKALEPADVAHVIHCRNCKYFRAHRCMDSMPIEICDLDQTFYDPDRDFCSLAESREG